MMKGVKRKRAAEMKVNLLLHNVVGALLPPLASSYDCCKAEKALKIKWRYISEDSD